MAVSHSGDGEYFLRVVSTLLLLLLFAMVGCSSEHQLEGAATEEQNVMWEAYAIGDCDGALRLIESATTDEESSWRMQYIKGDCAIRQGDNASAVAAFVQAVNADPLNPKGYNRLGVMALATRDCETARNHFLMAFALNPEVYGIPRWIGGCYLHKGDFAKALPYLQQAYVLNNTDTTLCKQIGDTFYLQQRYEDALDIYQECLTLGVEDDSLLSQVGAVHERMHEDSLAKQYFESALNINAENTIAHAGLGWIALRAGETSNAKDHFTQALQYAPVSRNIRCNLFSGLGLVAIEEKNMDAATMYAEKAIELNAPYCPQLSSLSGFLDGR